MLQRLGIRGKLLAVVAVPTIVLLLAASFVVFNASVDQSAARNTAQLVEVVQSGSQLVEQVQAERATVSNYLRGVIDGESKSSAARAEVDAAVATISAAGANDPAYAAVAQAVVAAVNGATGADGLDAYRKIATVPPAQEGFPAWPDVNAVATAKEGFLRIANEVDAAATAAPVTDTGTVIRGLGNLIRAEADATETYLNEAKQYSDALPATFTAVDSAGDDFLIAANGVANRPDNAGVLRFTNDLRTRLSNIDGLRGQIRSRAILPGDAESAYSAMVASVFQLTRDVTDSAANRQLAAYLGAYESMNELFESMRLEEQYVARKIRQGQWIIGEPAAFQALYFGTNNALANAKLAVEGLSDIPPVPSFGVSYDVNERTGFQTVRDRLLADTSDEALLDQRNAAWEVQVGEELDALAPIRADILAEVKQGSSDSVRTGLIQLLATIAVAVFVVVLSLIVTLSMARRIVNPLRRLTTTATAVRQELPRLVERVALPGQTVDVSEVQIPVESQDEVGRLAEAFNSVNAATLAIASEQAALRGSISEMFVNVARRDQVLLNRQLSSIDEMERTEDNQTTLTKLFALDHLATRMRRNSESLLVLAGIDTGRRLRRSMPLSDVIRTASSEIEKYDRVQLELDADPSMLGHSALTAAHMFAELLENATVFSNPGSPVVVRTMIEGDNICVEVVDDGIGMTPEELAEANARVASTAASEILGAQRLGLFVVGRIARRVGAQVQLEAIEGGGICARVVMPPSLFDTNVVSDQGHQSSTAIDEGTHAPAALVHHSVSDSEVRDPVSTEEQRPESEPHGYQPSVLEEGAGLAGRTTESPEIPVAADVPPGALSAGVESLIAADAVSAPGAVPVDLDALTEGATQAGLPTRRRKRAAAESEAPQETRSMIGLPMRASDEQMTALESATTSGFTPILAADEVSPESAEQRARVFRGFRSLRGDDDVATLAPDSDSVDHALRRALPAMNPLTQTSEPAPVPALEPDADEFGADQQETRSPEQDAPHGATSPFAVEAADPRHRESPIVRQSPLIATGFTNEDADLPSASEREEAPTPFMAIPALEDDEPEQALPSPWSQPGESLGAGVESVALDDIPYPQPPSTEPLGEKEAVEASEAHAAPTFDSPLYPAADNTEAPAAPSPTGIPGDDWQQGPEDQRPQFESDPVTSVPSLDDLFSDMSHSEGSQERESFFARVFGRGRKRDGEPEGNVSQQPESVAAGADFPPSAGPPVDEPADLEPTWQGSVPTTSLDEDHEPSQFEPSDFEPSPFEPSDFEPSRSDGSPLVSEPWQPEDTATLIGQSPDADVTGPESPALPTPSAPDMGPVGFVPEVTGDESFEAEWPTAAPTAAADSADSHAVLSPGGVPMAYSPDQLASPLGWEAAGESALQAAAPDTATEYRPVVQINSDQQAEGSVDYASEVFSELSSLAAERPKVEKTRAGLVKRTPVEREAEPESTADVAAPDVPRDAEAVRNRFSSFYSGTHRAREDVKNFNDSTQGSLTEP